MTEGQSHNIKHKSNWSHLMKGREIEMVIWKVVLQWVITKGQNPKHWNATVLPPPLDWHPAAVVSTSQFHLHSISVVKLQIQTDSHTRLSTGNYYPFLNIAYTRCVQSAVKLLDWNRVLGHQWENLNTSHKLRRGQFIVTGSVHDIPSNTEWTL